MHRAGTEREPNVFLFFFINSYIQQESIDGYVCIRLRSLKMRLQVGEELCKFKAQCFQKEHGLMGNGV